MSNSYNYNYKVSKKGNPKDKMPVWAVVLIVILCVALVGGAVVGIYYLVKSKDNQDNETCSVFLDDNAFIVGTYYKSADAETGLYFDNRLYVSIYEDSELVFNQSYLSTEFVSASSLELDGEFNSVEGRYVYGDIGFIDLSETIYELTDGLGLEAWNYKNPEGNYILLYTEWTAGPIMSAPVTVYESGLYTINIPEYDGASVQVEHSYIYINYCEGGY